ncbi:MAG: hypothetical protein NTX87_20940 [Planctomycetota bacterium]|nr:hypothetical protein [Planctomycetota bacterium]
MSLKQGLAVGIAVLVGLTLVAGPAYAAKKDKTASSSVQAVTLPDGAAKALKDAFPNATTGTVKMENEGGMLLYSVALWEGSDQKTVTVSYDGTIAAVKTAIEDKDVPEAVAKAIRGADDAATVTRFLKVEVRAEVKQEDGIPKLAKCDTPKTAYEGVLSKGGQTGHIRVAADGRVITPLSWESPTPAPTAKARGGRGGGKGGGKRKNK